MVTATVDLAHGGRWTSLRSGSREWLWRRPVPARAQVRPGQAFVDAGGLEECLPTVRGTPDHGSAWSAAWHSAPGSGSAAVRTDEFTLERTIRPDGDALIAGYRLSGVPGWGFVWAAHALLELSDQARLTAPDGTVTRVYQDERQWIADRWPLPLGEFGPVDGTATGAILLDCPRVAVEDGPDRLTFALTAPGQPVSTAIWRNLGGFGGYRSVGVEPMLGRVFDRAEAGPGDLAILPADGVCEWQLRVNA
jgi:hypothetical protein